MVIAEGTSMKEVAFQSINIDGESYYKISNHDKMRPFFMSIVSDSNHWMFISSNGGLTAGRKDAENALFPYYTDDKVTESFDSTGNKSIFWIKKNNQSYLWEPFSHRGEGRYNCTRNLYKNIYGNKVLFEEINHDLEISFRYKWSSSNRFGFVKESTLTNHSDKDLGVKLLDGLQNIMPYGVTSDVQGIRSNLVDAYKRNELVSEAGLGIFALSSMIVDRAEPSEALKANITWSFGLDAPTYLLSTIQLDSFRKGEDVASEVDIKAEKGAYFISKELTVTTSSPINWIIVANVNQDASSIAELSSLIASTSDLDNLIKKDIETGTQRLVQRIAASDGIQLTADKKRNARHLSNTLFNIMRGGIFDLNYDIEKWDFSNYLKRANSDCFKSNSHLLSKLTDIFSLQELRSVLEQCEDAAFTRLALEYMPLKFSRRHGDPSRPWNKFSINTRNEVDGSKILDYEGNWRDIFQNWEALAHSYPTFIESMIHKFLNASTFDGYNPYKVTKGGFDWEAIEPDDPWSYIGYWGDHQIIYLQKFLEFIQNYYPGRLANLFTQDLFVYANVPYRIKSYKKILENPKDTIVFDEELDKKIRINREEMGADGALLQDRNGQIHRISFIEKILATSLAKLSNFIPEAGIWLNTQRPEWNDANNALVGNGVSMVTLYYLRRFFCFFQKLFLAHSNSEVKISKELFAFFNEVKSTLESNLHMLEGSISDLNRKQILDGLGEAGSNYRDEIYNHGFSSEKWSLSLDEVKAFVEVVISFLDHTIEANKRPDSMYHSYNLMTSNEGKGITITRLEEMLEGQVAVLSSGYLDAPDCIALLDALKKSKLFREDQYSYLLYPDKELPGFMNKNVIPANLVESSQLLTQLAAEGNNQIIKKDISGSYHFNGDFNNADDLKIALGAMKESHSLSAEDERSILQAFEHVFNHKAFTGRSGTFYGYEGLGSIYWHMVSKLLLAVEECCVRANEKNDSGENMGKLLEHFYEINEGIGVHKSPKLYGAFPIDPYSHTPSAKGAQQPGMTGQVKEDILSRRGELGIFVNEGKIEFNPFLLRADEFLNEPKLLNYVDIHQYKKSIPLSEDSLAFTVCQVPVIYSLGETNGLEIFYSNGESRSLDSLSINQEDSNEIFDRTGAIESIKASIKRELLK